MHDVSRAGLGVVANAKKFRERSATRRLLAGVVAIAPYAAACGGSSNAGSSGTASGATSNAGGSGTNAGATGGASGTAASSGTTPQGGGDDAGGPTTDAASTVTTTPGTCPTPTVQIDFSPMYSAFIAGSTTHTFQIPAVTDDGNAATWSVSDPTQAQLVPQAFGDDPGVMITVEGVGTGTTGEITVYATESDGSCGASVLTLTPSTEDDWTIGNARYNDGISLSLARPDGGPPVGGGAGPRTTADAGSFFERDGGTACTNCHGATATTGPYRNVSHTPEQTGGFSDTDLIQIITQGEIPDGGYFDPSVINAGCDGGATCTQAALAEWHSFHQWADITSDQYPGIIVYLRSLQPEAQMGSPAANFGGVGRGRRDGGAFERDAGPRLRDAAGD
jgi:hypothetical protein